MSDKSSWRSPSPPTDRVVSIIELLASHEGPASAAELADTLGLNRSTAGAILSVLHRRGWVVRLPDLRYILGPGIAAVAERVHFSYPLPTGASECLDALAERVRCGAALGAITNGRLVFVALAGALGHLPAGIEVGVHLPLHAPAGASVIAFTDRTDRERWLDTAPQDRRKPLSTALEQITRTGVAVWGADEADIGRIEVLVKVATRLSLTAVDQRLREQVQELIAETGAYPYPQHILESDTSLPVSYLSAPVTDRDGNPQWELQIGPLRPAVTRHERETYIRELLATATELSRRSP